MVESSKGFMMAEVAMRFVFDLDWLRHLMLNGLTEVLVEKPYFSIKAQPEIMFWMTG